MMCLAIIPFSWLLANAISFRRFAVFFSLRLILSFSSSLNLLISKTAESTLPMSEGFYLMLRRASREITFCC